MRTRQAPFLRLLGKKRGKKLVLLSDLWHLEGSRKQHGREVNASHWAHPPISPTGCQQE
jgi:hypothetical protein